MSIIIVLGSRKFSNYELFSLTMSSICKAVGRPTNVITGNMDGIDTFTQQWAFNNVIPYEIHTNIRPLMKKSTMVLVTFSSKKSIWLKNVEKKANKLGIRHFDIHV